jgi:hypothetical protein
MKDALKRKEKILDCITSKKDKKVLSKRFEYFEEHLKKKGIELDEKIEKKE